MSRAVYVLHCVDDQSCGMVENGSRFGGSTLRMNNLLEHRVYQAATNDPNSANYICKIAAGPNESECGRYMIGSTIIVDATREAVDKFHKEDPFYVANVWKTVTISKWMSNIGIKSMTVEKDGDDNNSVRLVPTSKL